MHGVGSAATPFVRHITTSSREAPSATATPDRAASERTRGSSSDLPLAPGFYGDPYPSAQGQTYGGQASEIPGPPPYDYNRGMPARAGEQTWHLPNNLIRVTPRPSVVDTGGSRQAARGQGQPLVAASPLSNVDHVVFCKLVRDFGYDWIEIATAYRKDVPGVTPADCEAYHADLKSRGLADSGQSGARVNGLPSGTLRSLRDDEWTDDLINQFKFEYEQYRTWPEMEDIFKLQQETMISYYNRLLRDRYPGLREARKVASNRKLVAKKRAKKEGEKK